VAVLPKEEKKERAIHFLLGRQGARDAAIISSAFSAAGKVMGYARTLLTAYFFGASAFVDAYYVAFGAVAFITGTLERSMEAAVMPKLVQNDEATAAALFSFVAQASVAVITAISLLILLFPDRFILIFASTFDAPRVAIAGGMVRWALPWGVAAIIMSLFSAWANYTNRFIAPSAVYSLSNVFTIPALLLLYAPLKETALPASQSVGFIILAFCMRLAVGRVPFRAGSGVSPDLKIAVVKDAALSMVWSGAVFIYAVVDRYFASSLPAGNVSAISYAHLVFQHPLGVMGAALTIYFVRASEAARSKPESESLFFTALFVAWSYSFPAAILLSLLANPVIELLLGYGAFDARAVALTSPCLAVTALGLPVLICNIVVGKYALAVGRLKALIAWSYVGVVGNAVLDWFLVKPLGAPGLCAATTVMWYVSTLCLTNLLAPGVLKKLTKTLWAQAAVAAAWALPFYYVTRTGVFIPLLLGAFIGTAHILLCEKLGLLDRMPEQWRAGCILRAAGRKIFKGIR